MHASSSDKHFYPPHVGNPGCLYPPNRTALRQTEQAFQSQISTPSKRGASFGDSLKHYDAPFKQPLQHKGRIIAIDKVGNFY